MRGDTIWVGDRSYSSITLNKAASGTTPITIKKATAAIHGTSTGWSNAFADGRATISDITMVSNYWIVDGQTRKAVTGLRPQRMDFASPAPWQLTPLITVRDRAM